MRLSDLTLNNIRHGTMKIGYVNTTVEESGFGAIPFPAQGWALEILTFCLGTLSGGIAAGFLGALGNDLYSKIKEFFCREKSAIFTLRDVHKKTEHKPFCYAFVFEHDGIKLAIAYDIRDDHELEYCVRHCKQKILQELSEATKSLPEGCAFVEIDVEIDKKKQMVVGHRFGSTANPYLWFTRFNEITEEELNS